MTNPKLRRKVVDHPIATVRRELSNSARTAMSDPQFIATMRQIQRTIAESAQLQRATSKRIKELKANQAARSPEPPGWRKKPPDAEGMWLLRCMECPDPAAVRVYSRPGGHLMADCDIGAVGLMDLHNGLTNVLWARADPVPGDDFSTDHTSMDF